MRKVFVFLAVFVFNLHFELKAQQSNESAEIQDDKHKNFINKGDLSLGVLYLTNPVSTTQNMKYETRGAETNLVYYAFNRIGLGANFSSFKYHDKPGNNKSTNQDLSLVTLDKKRVLMVGPSIRYNFLEKYHCGTLYLQSGYSFGWFEDESERNIHRWEIATIGFTSSALRKIIPNLDMDFKISLTKDNLHSNLPKLYKAGLTYQFGNIKEQKTAEF